MSYHESADSAVGELFDYGITSTTSCLKLHDMPDTKLRYSRGRHVRLETRFLKSYIRFRKVAVVGMVDKGSQGHCKVVSHRVGFDIQLYPSQLLAAKVFST